jgi:hypothetical protein
VQACILQRLSSDGTEIMYAIVADKPQREAVAKTRGPLKDRLRKLIGR